MRIRLLLVGIMATVASACPIPSTTTSGETAVPADCTELDCPTNAQCMDADGGPRCVCDDGFELEADVCIDLDECAEGLDDCSADAACENTDGSFACACVDGFLGDGVICVVPSLDVTSGKVGAEVVIMGPGLGGTEGAVQVGGQPATMVSWTDAQATMVVPDVPPGATEVEVQDALGNSAALPFEVVMPAVVYAHSGADINGAAGVFIYDVNEATGVLTPRATPVPLPSSAPSWGGLCAEQMVVHRPTRRLFVTSGNHVSSFDNRPANREPHRGSRRDPRARQRRVRRLG